MIERLLYRLAEDYSFKSFEEFRNEDDKIELRERGQCTGIIPRTHLYIRRLHIDLACRHFAGGDTCFGEKDLVVRFYDPHLSGKPEEEKEGLPESYADGIHAIVKRDYLDTLAEELSSWQSCKRPFSRLLCVLMHWSAVLMFGMFLYYQAATVIKASYSPPNHVLSCTAS